jgi:hypothetical protein
VSKVKKVKKVKESKRRDYCWSQDKKRARLSVLLGVDAKLSHSRLEGRTVHAEAGGSTMCTPHPPFARGKRPHDLIALLSFVLIVNADPVTA